MEDDTRVEWREWGEEAFREAADRERPVLLSLSATWCTDCHEMDVETYGEPRIAANVNDGFVPVRVDVDRHPRVRERYNMGGFPSTVFTTPDGRLMTGATYLGPDGMRQVLDRVRETWEAKGADAGRVPRALADNPTPAGEVTDTIEEHLAGQLGEKFDDRFGGWGDDAKFPLPRTIEFALKREREQARKTLDGVYGGLFDEENGGFYRYAGARDWTDPHREKTLDANAALLRAFANGYLYTGEERYREAADGTVGFLVDELWNGAAFGGSQAPDEGSGDGELATGPRTDLTAYADANALAADALLTLAAYTDDGRARAYADRTLDYLRAELVAGDGEVTHFRAAGGEDGAAASESGLLTDSARVAGAFARATQVLGGDDHLDAARGVADAAVDALQGEGGAFRDGPAEGPGLLDRPLRPLDGNVEMADALLDLWVLTGEERYREAAHDAVGAFAGAWDRIGVQVAGYGSVAARLRRPPLSVEVGAAPGSDLHRAALRVADHEKVVRPDAPGVAADAARVSVGDASRTVESPEELVAAVSELGDTV